jgi:UDP-N-acetylglucosamine diphosphorylase/glucosamine-1-phosphate N-acetyltransferase
MPVARAAVVLAAGKGKRMKSYIPKVLHRLHGRPLITYLMDTLTGMSFVKIIVVIGFKGEMVEDALRRYPVEFVWQRDQRGTGHAVQMAHDNLRDFSGTTLIALGDVPFLTQATIERLFDVHDSTHAAATCLSAVLEDPTGYGRIVRVGGTDELQRIVEDRDANPIERKMTEINTGLLCFDNQQLFQALAEIKDHNLQGELYLTDTINILHNKSLRVSVQLANNPVEVMGINTMQQLAELERKLPAPFDR